MAPLLQQFFSCFDGIYGLRKNTSGANYVIRKYSSLFERSDSSSTHAPSPTATESKPDKLTRKQERSDSVEIPSRIERITKNICIDDVLTNDSFETTNDDQQFAEIYQTFSPSVAYEAYVLFCRVLGNIYVDSTLYNSDLILQVRRDHR